MVKVVRVQDLNRSVRTIVDLKDDMALSYHRIGVELKKVLDRGLWVARRTPDGEQMFSSFLEWARSECGLERQQIRAIMGVAANFSEQEIKKFGPSKLDVILTVPKEHRGRLMQEIVNGSTRVKLREIARGIPGVSPRIKGRTARATIAAAQSRKLLRASTPVQTSVISPSLLGRLREVLGDPSSDLRKLLVKAVAELEKLKAIRQACSAR